jgi:hypothetical protein
MGRGHRLPDVIEKWKTWATSAGQHEPGWETKYPAWEALARVVESSMIDPRVTDEQLSQVAFCWSLSEKGQEFSRFAGRHDLFRVLKHVATAGDVKARWQAYAALAHASPEAKEILEIGLQDADPRCRRQALLSWARLRLPGQGELIEKYLIHPDPDLRSTTLALAEASGDAALFERVRTALLFDREDRVREEARKAGAPSGKQGQ